MAATTPARAANRAANRAADLVPGSVAEHTSCLLLKLGQVAFRLSEHRLAELGLRVRHYSVLQALLDNGPMSQLDLGAHLRIDAATMVSTLDTLEQGGYAQRTRDPRDRRRYLVAATEKGADLGRDADGLLREVDESAFADLSATDRKHLHRILGRLAGSPALTEAFDTVRGG
ncbi:MULTISPECIES: MarR family winged helix-turn-helix transcriptional regulator [Streptomyces]|uniref:HTH marR-type domain-containing protein n=1 Tax=Streptomyces albus (strain ATCC 21838 / DSM 41398 / FERM P-419 / JCM 4703 / NBRC 107858) TaxID=1081613 RepID=A0A0B5EYF1_STRA4|nr:MarR family winged helix-turn-helix transcriptional regulator [Streptomyces sp. SCSIO ZS0520]AJE83681.1 hypothetical protein SLNWT_3305 [Streptomyces albus]AOU77989.1 hypothetical protein SLNHY_3298 [Streptomyces albus]